MKKIFLLFFVLLLRAAAAQEVHLVVSDSLSGEKLPGAVIVHSGKSIGVTDPNGEVHFTADSVLHLSVHFTGYLTKNIRVTGKEKIVNVRLLPLNPELETVTVTSTRGNSRIDDTPTKTEVLGQEDMDEENGIKPGNVSSLLGDLSSIQIQTTAAVSGQSIVRIQGLDGRYTQLLRDGLPVYDGFASGFSILQLPPQDLKQIELIKGPASTLYGGGAISGLINFVSRTPSDSGEHSLTLNATTLQESNINFWSSKQLSPRHGYTFMGAGTYANAVDVNKDGFTDVPGVQNVYLHPRYFFTPDKKNSFTFGIDAAYERRKGGDVNVLDDRADSLHRFFEDNLTQRITGEFLYHHAKNDSTNFDVRGSATFYDRSLQTENGKFNGLQSIQYLEVTRFIHRGKNALVLGANLFYSRFDQQSPVFNERIRINQQTTGIFAQHTWNPVKRIFIESGLRGDLFHDERGNNTFLLPRIALLWKWSDLTGMRICGGMGYKTINPLLTVEEHELPGVTLTSIKYVRAEHSYGGIFDVYWRRRLGESISLYLNQSFFLTQVNDPLIAYMDTLHRVYYASENKPLQTYGSDSYVRLTGEDVEVYLGYTWTHAIRNYNDAYPHIPLTPAHRVSFTALYELDNEKWRFGLEGSWIGSQYREDGTQTPSYVISAVMINYNWRNFSFVLNGEDLLDVRQSKYEPLFIGPISSPVFTPLWAPVDGRVINFSVRWKW